MAEQQNTRGILGDFPRARDSRVIDEKGRDARKEIQAFRDAMERHRDQIWTPEHWSFH
jgi:hypothetical protein